MRGSEVVLREEAQGVGRLREKLPLSLWIL